MITTIILIILMFLSKIYHDYVKTNSSIYFFVLFSILLIFHTVGISLDSFNYNIWKTQRDAFVKTLHKARESGNQLEIDTITKEISNWNVELETSQYINKNIFLGQYIDDRFEDLKPIK